MSNQQSSSSYSSSSFTTSSYSTSSSENPQGYSKSITQTATSNDRDGTNIRRTTEETGKPTLQDETYIPPGGRQIGSSQNSAGRIEDVSDEQKERDREYEERMEDEYAKREGGA
ncbi:hypothetical protein H2200_008959 [Cladophialophora chaetospira]|uniref:Uncharacterized protein n=1 Tax=Cladophialophora chaetospira TaxID=386627 RepID=A0AA38X528_9EURO|nr:hypothetical protein H2200_008959 [Cladophialophora chaetospira]